MIGLDASKRFALKKRSANLIGKLFVYIMLFSLAYLLLYPLLYMIVTVFRSAEDLRNPAVVWITRTYSLENLKLAIRRLDFVKAFFYSLGLALPCAVLQTVSCALAGYGFARFKFKGQFVFFGILVLSIVVPSQTILIPWYGVVQSLGLLGSRAAFWIQSALGMSFKSGLFIFIFYQFYKGLPKELEAAAMLDGCSTPNIFLRIMLPNVVPAIVTVFFFSFVWHWNENYLTKFTLNIERTLAYNVSGATDLLISSDMDTKVIQAIIQSGSLLLLAPALILFFVLQRYLREGITRSGIVG